MGIMLLLFAAVLALVLLNVPIAVSLGVVAVAAVATSGWRAPTVTMPAEHDSSVRSARRVVAAFAQATLNSRLRRAGGRKSFSSS